MKATIKTQGSQYTVEKGDKLFVNRFPDTNAGDQVKLDQVLMVLDEGKPTFGSNNRRCFGYSQDSRK